MHIDRDQHGTILAEDVRRLEEAVGVANGLASRAVRLADGREYEMVEPTVEMVAHVGPGPDGRAIRLETETSLPGDPDYGQELARVLRADMDDAFFAGLVALALRLLRRRYMVPDSAVPRLFRFGPDMVLARDLYALVTGRLDPKAAQGPTPDPDLATGS